MEDYLLSSDEDVPDEDILPNESVSSSEGSSHNDVASGIEDLPTNELPSSPLEQNTPQNAVVSLLQEQGASQNRVSFVSHRKGAPHAELLSPSEHSYLGQLNEISGCTIFEENSVVKLPLILCSTAMIVPGQKVPFIEKDNTNAGALEYAIKNDRVVAVVSLEFWHSRALRVFLEFPDEFPDEFRMRFVPEVFGTTATIHEWSELESGGYKVKAVGQQRFQLQQILPYTVPLGLFHRLIFVLAKILPEVRLPYVLQGVRDRSLDSIRAKNRYRCMKTESQYTIWPAWVYQQYDAEFLVKNIKKYLMPKESVGLVSDPVALSYQLCKVVPFELDVIKTCMKLNSSVQRLRLQLNTLRMQEREVLCVRCKHFLAEPSDIFPLVKEGPQGTFVNPDGFVHEVLTVKKVADCTMVGQPDSRHSWYPGYSWIIVNCAKCRHHLGWKFEAIDPNAEPKDFWGIKSSSVVIRIKHDSGNDVIKPVF